MSIALAPFSACSSPVVKRISIPAGGLPSRTSRRTAPRIVTTAALLSAPRMASWRFVRRPSWLTTSTGPSSGTVSMCAHSRTVGAPSGPGTRASRFPESEPVCDALSSSSTSMPSPRSSSVSACATARSRPDGLSISQRRMNSARSRSRSSLDTAWITPRTLPLDRPALSLPARDAAVHHVDHLAGAEPLQETGGDRGPLSGRADHGHRLPGLETGRRLVDVVVGRVDRARDVAGVPLGALAHVEQLEPVRAAVPALVELLQGQPGNALDRALLLAPGRHATGEIAGNVREADRAGQLGGITGVLVVAAHQHQRLPGLGEPRQPGAEAAAERRDAHRRGDVRFVELQLGAHVHHHRAVLLPLLHLARSERVHVDR